MLAYHMLKSGTEKKNIEELSLVIVDSVDSSHYGEPEI